MLHQKQQASRSSALAVHKGTSFSRLWWHGVDHAGVLCDLPVRSALILPQQVEPESLSPSSPAGSPPSNPSPGVEHRCPSACQALPLPPKRINLKPQALADFHLNHLPARLVGSVSLKRTWLQVPCTTLHLLAGDLLRGGGWQVALTSFGCCGHVEMASFVLPFLSSGFRGLRSTDPSGCEAPLPTFLLDHHLCHPITVGTIHQHLDF